MARRCFVLAVVAAAMVALVGCEWAAKFVAGAAGPGRDGGGDVARRDGSGDGIRNDGAVDGPTDGVGVDASESGTQVRVCPAAPPLAAAITDDAVDLAADPTGAPHIAWVDANNTLRHTVGDVVSGSGFTPDAFMPALVGLPPSPAAVVRVAIGTGGRVFLLATQDKRATLYVKSSAWTQHGIVSAAVVQTAGLTSLGAVAYGVVAVDDPQKPGSTILEKLSFDGSLAVDQQAVPNDRWFDVTMTARDGIIAWTLHQSSIPTGQAALFDAPTYRSFAPRSSYTEDAAQLWGIALTAGVAHIFREENETLEQLAGKFNGTWNSFQTTAVTGVVSSSKFAAAVDEQDRLYVAYRDTARTKVLLLISSNGSAWTKMSAPLFDGTASNARVALAVRGGLLHAVMSAASGVRYTCRPVP